MLSYTGQFPLIRPVGHLLPQGEGTCGELERIRYNIEDTLQQTVWNKRLIVNYVKASHWECWLGGFKWKNRVNIPERIVIPCVFCWGVMETPLRGYLVTYLRVEHWLKQSVILTCMLVTCAK